MSIALLYISVFPLFALSSTDNDKYLQALRHFYALACETRQLLTIDCFSNSSVSVNAQIFIRNSLNNTKQLKKIELTTPINVINFLIRT